MGKNRSKVNVIADNIGYVFFMLTFIVVVLVNVFLDNKECSTEKRIKDLEINGKILDKYLDSNNHLYQTILVNGDIQRKIWFFNKEFFNYVNIDDSILSRKGELDVKVFRDQVLDTVITLDYGCDE